MTRLGISCLDDYKDQLVCSSYVLPVVEIARHSLASGVGAGLLAFQDKGAYSVNRFAERVPNPIEKELAGHPALPGIFNGVG